MFELPDPSAYPPEGGEVGEVVAMLRSAVAEAADVFPGSIPTLAHLLRTWEWNALDNCYKLQHIAQTFLGAETEWSSQTVFPTKTYNCRIVQHADVAPVFDNDEDWQRNYFWSGPTLPHLEITIAFEGSEGGTFKLESFRKPNGWKLTGMPKNGQDFEREYYFDNHEESLEQYSQVLLGFDISKTLSNSEPLSMLPSPACGTEDQQRKFWDTLNNLHSFRGVGSPEDEKTIGQVMFRFAQATDIAWMRVVASCPEEQFYEWNTTQKFRKGPYTLLCNAIEFKAQTPQGLLHYKPSSWLGSKQSEWTLGEQVISEDDPRLKEIADALSAGTWVSDTDDTDASSS